MGKNRKRPRISTGHHPSSTEKQPYTASHCRVASSNAERPVWKLEILDLEGPWKQLPQDKETWTKILSYLQEMEGLSWAEIEKDKKRNHSVSVRDFGKDARIRLEKIQQDDQDEFFRFRISGTARLWGIRDRHVFKILWWDPEHRVCLSSKK